MAPLPQMGYGPLPQMGYGPPNTNPAFALAFSNRYLDTRSQQEALRGFSENQIANTRGQYGALGAMMSATPGLISARQQIPLANIRERGESGREQMRQYGSTTRNEISSARALMAALNRARAGLLGTQETARAGMVGTLGAADLNRRGLLGATRIRGQTERDVAGTQAGAQTDVAGIRGQTARDVAGIGLEGQQLASQSDVAREIIRSVLGLEGVGLQTEASRDVAGIRGETAVRVADLQNLESRNRQERARAVLPFIISLLQNMGNISGLRGAGMTS
jgi:hypothetical protein